MTWVAGALLWSERVSADTTYSSDYRYVDGTSAHAETVCATADLCGTIALRGGDVIYIFAESMSGCSPPTLHVVRRRGAQLLLSYQVVPTVAAAHRQASASERSAAYGCRGATAYVAFDKGRIRLAVVPLATGDQAFVRFAAGVSQERTNAAPAFIKGS